MTEFHKKEVVMTETKISERLRQDANSIWKRILDHPFVTELYTGILPIEKFRFYVLQDYNYLVNNMRNLGILSSKAESIEAMREMLEIAHLEATSEFESYEGLLNKLGYTTNDAISTVPTQTNASYGNFLLATSCLKTFWEGLAATLPCFWTYAEIAQFHEAKLNHNKNSLYCDWALVYLTDDYCKLVNRLRCLLDKASGLAYSKFRELFITASNYEYMYWDMAYQMKV